MRTQPRACHASHAPQGLRGVGVTDAAAVRGSAAAPFPRPRGSVPLRASPRSRSAGSGPRAGVLVLLRGRPSPAALPCSPPVPPDTVARGPGNERQHRQGRLHTTAAGHARAACPARCCVIVSWAATELQSPTDASSPLRFRGCLGQPPRPRQVLPPGRCRPLVPPPPRASSCMHADVSGQCPSVLCRSPAGGPTPAPPTPACRRGRRRRHRRAQTHSSSAGTRHP